MSLPPGLLPIARQLHTALLLEIGHEIEIERLVGDGRYARDVLLVCDACPTAGLPQLAAQFRALVPPPATDAHEDDAPVMDVPPSMAMRAMAAAWSADSGPIPAADMAGPPPSAPRGPQRQAAHQASAASGAGSGSWLQRWWARWRGR